MSTVKLCEQRACALKINHYKWLIYEEIIVFRTKQSVLTA